MNGTTPIVEDELPTTISPESDEVEFAGSPEVGEKEFEKVSEIETLDVSISLSEEDRKKIVSYLDDNLPKMRATTEETQRITAYLAMYDMAAKKRNFPYEGAPSIASTDAYDKLNEFLDHAETAFLQQRITFSIDREDSPYSEEQCRRIEKTVHRKVFLESGLADELRLMLFEASFLGGSVVIPREIYDIQPMRERIIISSEDDLEKFGKKLNLKQLNEAREKVSNGERYMCERDTLRMVNIGPSAIRINQSQFLYPRNTKFVKEWQIVAEREFYTKSALRDLASRGQVDGRVVEKAIASRLEMYRIAQEAKRDRKGVVEPVKPHRLDSDWMIDFETIKTMGDAYEDEFAVYRVTMLYNAKTNQDLKGALRTWIEVLYCPAAQDLLGAKFCPDGFPYHIIQVRPVPYRAVGPGMAQARYSHNMLDSDIKSMYLACMEQELGSPLMIREGSSLFATDFRAYPGSAVTTGDPERDAKFMTYPEKSRLAIEGMRVILGSSPMSNLGAGYASGKREELLRQQEMTMVKARIHTLAMGMDKVFNTMWKILCRMSKLNMDSKKYISWVYREKPDNKKLYVLESEMDPDITWSSALSATSLTPDARFQRFLVEKEILHDKVPASVNSPRLTIAWLERAADHFDDIDEEMRIKLLPNEQDFMALQASLGQQGAQMGGAPGGGTPPLVAQSQATPFRNPAATR